MSLNSLVKGFIEESIKAHKESLEIIDTIVKAAEVIIAAINNGKKIVVIGNGGSAADASHMAAELVGRYNNDRRRPLPAIALTTDTSILTAISNDFGFEEVYSKQCRALLNKGDVMVAISTSGRSKNIIEAIKVCKDLGVYTILLTGNNDSDASRLADLSIKVPSTKTPIIQGVHRTIIHAICAIIDEYYAKE